MIHCPSRSVRKKKKRGSLPPAGPQTWSVVERGLGVARLWLSEGQIALIEAAREPGIERLAPIASTICPARPCSSGIYRGFTRFYSELSFLSDFERQIGLI
jgi:hypothetical protein